MFVPTLRNLFELNMLSGPQWLTVLGLCLAMLAFIEIQKLVARLREN